PVLTTRMHANDSTLEVQEDGWTFEEALLDENHCYAIAAQTEMEGAGPAMDGTEIQRLDWKELLKDAVPYPISHT
ncbi:hypothetical protein BGW38_009342, partial [Lunasporangiospora selenospora]